MVCFWNGNKSSVRQHHELDVLKTLLTDTEYSASVYPDLTNYPDAADESNIFFHGTDVMVTVAGNQKFAHRQYFSVPYPVCEGILGHRLCVIRKTDTDLFRSITYDRLQNKVAGVPATWADADILRHHQFPVYETGDPAAILTALKHRACDYVALGLNEAEDILSQFPDLAAELCIEPTTLIYYPLPLIFYVSPRRPDLKRLLNLRAKQYSENGEIARLVYHHYGEYIRRARLKSRHVIYLDNPFLPEAFAAYDFSVINESYA